MDAQNYRVWDPRARRILTSPEDGTNIYRLPGQHDLKVYWFNPVSKDWDLVEGAEVDNATPFHDCHGRVIYENDIVRTPFGDGRVYMSRDTGQWMIQLDVEIPELFAMGRQFTEIIGTVYQNPELIVDKAVRSQTDEET